METGFPPHMTSQSVDNNQAYIAITLRTLSKDSPNVIFSLHSLVHVHTEVTSSTEL